MWSPDPFLEHLFIETTPLYRFKATTAAEWKKWREDLLAILIRSISLPDRSGTALNPAVLERVDCTDYIRERIQLATAPHLDMPCYLLIPKNATPPYSSIVACPGHGYGSKQLVGLRPDGSERLEEAGIYKDYPIELVKRGWMVIVPEPLGLGDRRLKQDRDKAPNENSCASLATNLLMLGKSLAGYRVHEMMCCVDYLLSRRDTAPERIGCMGFSGGGLVLALTAAIDERIRATVISGYTNTYRDAILAKPHCFDNYIPGMSLYADFPDLMGLIAPRPLLIEAGEHDRGFPVSGALAAIEQVSAIYKTISSESQVAVDIHPGKHEVSGRIAYDWLEAQLN